MKDVAAHSSGGGGYNLFHAWLISRVTMFLESFSKDLGRMLHQPSLTTVQEVVDRWSLRGNAVGAEDSASTRQNMLTLFAHLQSLISQSMYFGRAFSRVGCDFRAHLACIFGNSIVSYSQVTLLHRFYDVTMCEIQ